jgi:hypothetical protein
MRLTLTKISTGSMASVVDTTRMALALLLVVAGCVCVCVCVLEKKKKKACGEDVAKATYDGALKNESSR